MPWVQIRTLCSNASIAPPSISRKRVAALAQQKSQGSNCLGQRQNPQVDLLRHEQLQHLVRPPLARLVAVQHQVIRSANRFSRPDVIGAQGGPQHGNHVATPA
jgi:hypothetical protein